eukprot:IDg8977t1
MHISSSKVSYVIPATFEEKILRIYLRKERGPDFERYKAAAKLAFRNFTRRANLVSPAPSPPLPTKNGSGLAGVHSGTNLGPAPMRLDGKAMMSSTSARRFYKRTKKKGSDAVMYNTNQGNASNAVPSSPPRSACRSKRSASERGNPNTQRIALREYSRCI